MGVDERGAGEQSLARLAASALLDETDSTREKTDLALQYQLISPWTHCIVVAEREAGEAGDGLPQQRQVPHMVPAGWGGSGSVVCASEVIDVMMSEPVTYRLERDMNDYDRTASPSFLRSRRESTSGSELKKFVRNLNRAYPAEEGKTLDRPDLSSLRALGLEDSLLERIVAMVDQGVDELVAVAAFFSWLLAQPVAVQLEIGAARVCRLVVKRQMVAAETMQRFEDEMTAVV